MFHRHLDMTRLLVLPYIGLAAWIGLSYLNSAPRRLASPSLDQPKELARILTDAPGMNAWGVVFLLGAIAMATAALLPEKSATFSRREVLVVLLFIGGVMYAFWGAVFLWGALEDPRASLVATGLYWFISCTHFTAVWFINLLRAYHPAVRP